MSPLQNHTTDYSSLTFNSSVALRQSQVLLHDAAQSLTVILSLAEIDLHNANIDEEVRQDINTILEQANSLKQIMGELQRLAHSGD